MNFCAKHKINLFRTDGRFLLCKKKTVTFAKNNNETMNLLVYPKDEKETKEITGFFKKNNINFEYENAHYREIMQDIEESLKDIADGKVFSHEEVMEETRRIMAKYPK